VSQPDTWCLLNQLTSFKFGVFGFRVGGFFNSVFSNYNVEPAFPEDFFTRETFRIEANANKRDTTYWAIVRPVPLTPEEVRDYVRKDSIAVIRDSKAYKDSMDRRANRFKPGNLISGYTWRNSYKKTSVSYPAAPQWIQFNTVQGWLLNVQPEYSRYDGDYRSRFWRVEGTLNYGLSERRLRYGLKASRRLEAVHYRTVEAEGGVLTEQFNQKRPIGPLTNTLYSLFLERNYLKLYEKAYGRLGWSQRFPGMTLGGMVEFSERRPLVNHSDQTWYKGEDRAYTPNAPVLNRDPAEPFFEKHRAFLLGVELRFRPEETYSTYPDFRIYHGSDWPEFRVSYRKAIPGVAGSAVNYDLIQAGIFQNELSLGLAGFTEINLRGGLFLNRRRVEFMDMYHPVGNQTILARPAEYGQSFFLLPYYGYGTDRAFVEAHLQHQLDGWLLDKLPLIRRLNWKEVFGAGIYYSDRPVVEQSGRNPLPYWEVNAGLKNIGFSLVRPLRIDVAAGFFGREHYRTSIVLGLTL
jgi:hypothetical protein